MLFNHDPPRCVECLDCGGPSRCGMECSALVAKNALGYQVCTTIGHVSSTNVSVIDEQNPYKGVIVRMSSSGKGRNCSLSVSIICDSTGVQGPNSMEKLGTCDYATVLRHPSGCATIISFHEKGFGWFCTLMTIILCLFGAYLLAGTVYRFFFLGVRGVEVIPNLEFWASLQHRTQSFFSSLVRKFSGPSAGHRSSYSRVNF
ncbi:Leucine-rich repeat and IQ domain-containing protein 3, putative isoform 3 [Theobroma cacao]|nr:Leucine-rich repeat and IQ domain-containing protein 3, putative isoform 3 [Theobroma cacao]